MASSKNFFGLRSGSTKTSTLRVLHGQQITLDRMGKPRNPQTDRQLLQRMRLAVVERNMTLLQGLIGESWESKNKRDALAAYKRANLLLPGGAKIYEYAPKDTSFAGLAELQISNGREWPCKVWFQNSNKPSDLKPSYSTYYMLFRPSPTLFQMLPKYPFERNIQASLDVVDQYLDGFYNDLMGVLNIGQGCQLTFLFCVESDEVFTFSDGFNTYKGKYDKYYITRIFNDYKREQRNITVRYIYNDHKADIFVVIKVTNDINLVICGLSNKNANCLSINIEAPKTTYIKAAAVIYSDSTNKTISTQKLVVNPAEVDEHLNFGNVKYSYLQQKRQTGGGSYYLNLGTVGGNLHTLEGADFPNGKPRT